MTENKYLSLDGLRQLVSNIASRFSTKDHTHTMSEVTDASTTIDSKISEHNIGTDAHNDIRILVDDLDDRLTALADSDDTTLDQLSEITAYIKANRELVEQVTTAKVSVDDIVDNLTTNVSDKPLSAAQGVVLNQLLASEVADIKNTYVPLSSRGMVNGVAPLNANKKIESQYLPVYTEINVTASDSIADLSAKQTWSSEQTYNYEDYGLVLLDTISGVAAGFKAPRGHFNQLFVDDIVFTRGTKEQTEGLMADEIRFYTWTGVESKAAVRDTDGNITTEGYNNLVGYTPVAAITKDGGLVLKSSTSGSSKYFKLSVNDSGTISASEYTFAE